MTFRLVLGALALGALCAPPAVALGAGKSAVPAIQTLERTRQGGDTMDDAFVVPTIPFLDTGTTVGYANDYEEACPYEGSTAPDVVYAYTPPADQGVRIDLCASGYDTKVYVYDDTPRVVACNDDNDTDPDCGVYRSLVAYVDLDGGTTYYIVVDGYQQAAGDYQLEITPAEGCLLACPDGGVEEGEPPFTIGYVDAFNGGCDEAEAGAPVQPLIGDESGSLVMCARSGWYSDGSPHDDRDWYEIQAGSPGTVTIELDGEMATTMMIFVAGDCEGPLEFVDAVSGGACLPGSVSLSMAPGAVLWLATGLNDPPPPWPIVDPTIHVSDYVVRLTGLDIVEATENVTWGEVKSLYR